MSLIYQKRLIIFLNLNCQELFLLFFCNAVLKNVTLLFNGIMDRTKKLGGNYRWE